MAAFHVGERAPCMLAGTSEQNHCYLLHLSLHQSGQNPSVIKFSCAISKFFILIVNFLYLQLWDFVLVFGFMLARTMIRCPPVTDETQISL